MAAKLFVIVVFSGLLLLAACGGGTDSLLNDDALPRPPAAKPDTAALIPGGHTASGFELGVLPDTFLGEEPAGEFTISEQVDRDGVLVTVRVTDADNLRAVYARLRYDARRFSPVSVDQLPLVANADGEDHAELLTLSNTTEPGVVDFGQVLANCDARDGLSGDAAVATLRFTRQACAGVRRVSTVPVTEEEKPNLLIDITHKRMQWDYFMRGDYNQDGLVGIGDLTPVGMHFGKQNKSAEFLPPDPFTPGTALWLADGNQDGEIGVQDITVIGQNYGRFVAGYNVYSSPSRDAGYPAGNSTPAVGQPAGFIPFSQIQGGSGGAQRGFDLTAPFLADGRWYWVRPTDGELDGSPSNAAMFDQSAAQAISLSFREEGRPEMASYDFAWTTFVDDGDLTMDIWLKNPVDIGLLVAELAFDAAYYDPGGSYYDPSQRYDSAQSGSMEYDRLPGRADLFSLHWSTAEPNAAGELQIGRLHLRHAPQTPVAELRPFYNTWGMSAFADIGPTGTDYVWYYTNDGDYNQDGVVRVTDVLQNLRFYNDTSAELLDPACLKYVVDGSRDGYVTVTDLTCIGTHFRCAVSGYDIFYTDDPEYFTDIPWMDDAWDLTGAEQYLGHVDFADALGERFLERLHFSFHLDDPVPGRYVWAVPEYNGEHGVVPPGSVAQIPVE